MWLSISKPVLSLTQGEQIQGLGGANSKKKRFDFFNQSDRSEFRFCSESVYQSTKTCCEKRRGKEAFRARSSTLSSFLLRFHFLAIPSAPGHSPYKANQLDFLNAHFFANQAFCRSETFQTFSDGTHLQVLFINLLMRMRDYRGIAARFSACAAAKIGARFLLPRYDVIHFSLLYGLRLDSRFQIQQGLA